MPRKRSDTTSRYRFWVGMDAQPELAEKVITWSKLAGLDYPADFIKMLIAQYGEQFAERLLGTKDKTLTDKN